MYTFTFIYIRLFTEYVGQDNYGNCYFQSRDTFGAFGRRRRLRINKNISRDSVIPSEWFLWLHYQSDLPPTENDAISRKMHWERDVMPNLTGTVSAHDPRQLVASMKEKKLSYGFWRP